MKNNALAQIGKIDKSNLFLIGVALYWAEGSKKTINRPGQCIDKLSVGLTVFIKILPSRLMVGRLPLEENISRFES